MSAKSATRHRWASVYSVHWMLTYQNGTVRQYGEAVRRSWVKEQPPSGERRLVCDYSANAIVVMVETVADDIVQAITETRTFVFGPLVRSDLPLPEAVAVIAAAVVRSAASEPIGGHDDA